MEEIAVEHLRQALSHYEKKKDIDERKKRFLSDPESELETIEAHWCCNSVILIFAFSPQTYLEKLLFKIKMWK